MCIVQIGIGRINPDSSNGVSRVIYNYNKYLNYIGMKTEVWAFYDKIKEPQIFKRDDTLTVKLFPNTRTMLAEIQRRAANIQLVHMHMIWRTEKIKICNELLKMNIPYVLSTHGGFSVLGGLSLKKKIGFAMYEKKIMQNASAIHALTYEELTDLRKQGISAPIFVLPNGVDIVTSHMEDDAEYEKKYNSTQNKMKLLFLARGSYQKNPDGITKAIALLPQSIRNKVVLYLCGPLDDEMKRDVNRVIDDNSLKETVLLVGEVHGSEKEYLLRNSDIYCLPSRFEGLAVSMIEAMAHRLPCLITRTSCVSYYYRYNSFEMCEPWPEDIARGIISLINRKDEWNEMGDNAYRCYRENFLWKEIVEKLKLEYTSILQSKGNNI